MGDRASPIQGSTAGSLALASARPHRASSETQTPGHIERLAAPFACGESAMTERIHEFLRRREADGPCLVVDLEAVRANYPPFPGALPDPRAFYPPQPTPPPPLLPFLPRP